MRKARHPLIKFLIGKAEGHFANNSWRNEQNIVFWKKTSVLARANLILQQQGHKHGRAKTGVYIKVTYGKHLDNWGKIIEFYNDGIYHTEKDIKEELAAFTEQSLIDYVISDS